MIDKLEIEELIQKYKDRDIMIYQKDKLFDLLIEYFEHNQEILESVKR